MNRFLTRLAVIAAAGILGAMAFAGGPDSASAGIMEPPNGPKTCHEQGRNGPALGLAFSGIGHSNAECEANATAKSGDTGGNSSNSGAIGGDGNAVAKGDATSGDTGDANTEVNGRSGDTGDASNSQSANSGAIGGDGGDSGDVSGGSGCCEQEKPKGPVPMWSGIASLWQNDSEHRENGCCGPQSGDGGDGGDADSEAKTEGDATSGDSKVEQNTTGGRSGDSGDAIANPQATGTGGSASSSSGDVTSGHSGPAISVAIAPFGDANAYSRSGDTGGNSSNSFAKGGDGSAYAEGDATSGDTGDANTEVNGQSGNTGDASNQQSANSGAKGGDGGDSGDVSSCGCEKEKDHNYPSRNDGKSYSKHSVQEPRQDKCGCEGGQTGQSGDGGDGGDADSEAKTEGDATSGDSKVEQNTTGGQSGDSGDAIANPQATGTGGGATSSSGDVSSGNSGEAKAFALTNLLGVLR